MKTLASVRERTETSLISWTLCRIQLGPDENRGLCAQSHWSLYEVMAPVHERTGTSLTSRSLCQSHGGLFEFMAPMRERTRASWKSWPLCTIELGPH